MQQRQSQTAITLGLALALGPVPGLNPAQASGFDSQHSLRTSLWSGDRQLSNEQTLAAISLWSKVQLEGDSSGRLVGQFWLRQEGSNDPTQPEMDSARLRELYYQWSGEQLDVKLGRQLLPWGRADGLNPTDNLSPRDFTLLAPEDADLRTGTDAVNISYSLGDHCWRTVWMPAAESHLIPLERSPGLSYQQQHAPERSQYALQWEYLGLAADASLSWFDGYDLLPDLALAGLGPNTVLLQLHNQPVQLLGADLSWAEGNRVWRAEAAYSRTESEGRADFDHKKDQFWLVAGPEWSLDNGLTLGLQASLKWVRDFAAPDQYLPSGLAQQLAWRQVELANQTRQQQSGISWRLAKTALNDSLLMETSGLALGAGEGGLSRVKLDYAPLDALHIQLGYEHYRGTRPSFFGQLARNRLGYVELRYDF